MKRQEPVTEALHYVTQALLPEKLLRLVHSYRLRGPFAPNEGHCWTAYLPQWRHLADSLETSQRSPLMLYENGIPFLEAHVPHRHIRTEGGGLFAHWQDSLFFSTSDNSNPNTNGRRYSYTVYREFYRPPARVWNDSRPVNLSQRDTSPEAIARDVAYALDVGRHTLGWLSEFGDLRGKVVLENRTRHQLLARFSLMPRNNSDCRRPFSSSLGCGISPRILPQPAC